MSLRLGIGIGACIVAVVTAIVLGLVFGLSEAALWIFGFIPAIRMVIPYAAADALLIFALTPILALIARNLSREGCISKYVATIMISDAIFLIFVQIFVGTVAILSRAAKIVLSFVGSISFWIMLIAFIAFVFYLVRRGLCRTR